MNIQNISKREPALNNENFNSKAQNQLNMKNASQESTSLFPREFGKDITNVVAFESNTNLITKDNVNFP